MPSHGRVARWERLQVMFRQLKALARAADDLEGKPTTAALQWHRDANQLEEWMGREVTRATVDALAADRKGKS